MSFDLESIATLSGVHQAVIADDAGRLLGCAGRGEPPTAAILVLAHATLSAAAELGRRSGTGDCLEILQQHEGGCIYLHFLPHHRVLLVRCQNDSSIPAVRRCSHGLSMESERSAKPAPVPALAVPAIKDLAAAFHAEPAW